MFYLKINIFLWLYRRMIHLAGEFMSFKGINLTTTYQHFSIFKIELLFKILKKCT